MSRRNRRAKKEMTAPEITLTPLIDTALTLLIIFMIATPMMHNVIKIELPSVATNEMHEHVQEEVIISITAQGTYHIADKSYTLPQLLTRVQQLVAQKKIEIVFVHADKAVVYGKVMHAIDMIKQSGGVKYVALAADKKVH